MVVGVVVRAVVRVDWEAAHLETAARWVCLEEVRVEVEAKAAGSAKADSATAVDSAKADLATAEGWEGVAMPLPEGWGATSVEAASERRSEEGAARH